MKTLTQFGAANKDTPIYSPGLMFRDHPAPPDPTTDPVQSSPEQNLKDLGGTSALRVDAKAAHTQGILDFPLGIAPRSRRASALRGKCFDETPSNVYLERALERMAATKADAPTPR